MLPHTTTTFFRSQLKLVQEDICDNDAAGGNEESRSWQIALRRFLAIGGIERSGFATGGDIANVAIFDVAVFDLRQPPT